MVLKKVHALNMDRNILVNTDNITYIEPYLYIYIVHLSCGGEINISKQEYIQIIGEKQ